MSNEEMVARAFAGIDAVHAEDPSRVEEGGRDRPAELVYAERMSSRLAQLVPDASPALRLAVRAQHLRRWATPRSDFPEGAAGYKRWRVVAALRHAEEAGTLVRQAGFGAKMAERVADLVLKKRRRADPEAQALEDVACLVFLEHYFEEFAAKHGDDKVVGIVRKTWGKMSERAREMAATMRPEGRAGALLAAALSNDTGPDDTGANDTGANDTGSNEPGDA